MYILVLKELFPNFYHPLLDYNTTNICYIFYEACRWGYNFLRASVENPKIRP